MVSAGAAANELGRFIVPCRSVKNLPRSFTNPFVVVATFGDAAAGIIKRPMTVEAIVVVVPFGPELAVWMPGARRAVALRNILWEMRQHAARASPAGDRISNYLLNKRRNT